MLASSVGDAASVNALVGNGAIVDMCNEVAPVVPHNPSIRILCVLWEQHGHDFRCVILMMQARLMN